MTEQDGVSGPSRPRPSYGLPGPAPAVGAPQDPSPQERSPQPTAPPAWTPADSSTPAPTPGEPRRSGGTKRIVIGLLMLLVLGPAALVLGLVLSFQQLIGGVTSGPEAMPGSTTTLEVEANSMVIVYVEEADAETAECTATSEDPGAVSAVPQEQNVDFGNGKTYHQTIGAVAVSETTMTITCTGTTSDAAYLGPFSLVDFAAPLMIGVVASIVLGLLGLILLIVGIVVKVRRRSA